MDMMSALHHSVAVVELIFGPPDTRAFDVAYWDGSTERGRGGAPYALHINRPGALRRMLLPPSEVALVEAYLSEDVDIVGDIEAAVTLGDAINERLASPGAIARLTRHLLALPKHDDEGDDPASGVYAARAEHTVGHAGAQHEKERDRSAIQYHYDVGNDFYRLWLDERMVYSCAYFEAPSLSLEEAQLAKLDLVCRKLRLKPGETLLDVGCGWGALIMHAAQHYGVNALGITLSDEQLELAGKRIDAAGLSDRCRVERLDYRDLPSDVTFDKIASVGMVEHVGVANLPVYFNCLHHALRPGGLFLNHGIVSVAASRPLGLRERVERKVWRRDEFIDQYVFPDGKLGPLHAVIAAAEGAGFETRDAESLREHYTRTLREWSRRLELHAAEAVALVGTRRFRTWRLYMAAAAHGFDSARLNVVQTLLARPDDHGRVNIPPTRADLFKY